MNFIYSFNQGNIFSYSYITLQHIYYLFLPFNSIIEFLCILSDCIVDHTYLEEL